MLLNHMHLQQVKADREREIAERICLSRLELESRSVRRALGRSIMAIGARLAAEPQPRLARSR